MRNRLTLQRARELRHRPTDAERRLWKYLRRRYLGCRFRRQFPIGRYIADFACLSARMVVEIDGGQHAKQRLYDASRDRFIREQGFVVLRFWDNEVLLQTEAVLHVIWRAVREGRQVMGGQRPPSCPSPAGAEEGTQSRAPERDL